jgi:trimethylamine-N-oxide reductase (cytochrome c)
MMPYIITERARVYSEKRIKYPIKEWIDPNGERHPENRGKSEYVRISWEEAFDIVAGEMKRIRETYGPAAITASTGSHHNWGLLFYKMGPFGRFSICWAILSYVIIPIAGKAGTGSYPYLGLLLASGCKR